MPGRCCIGAISPSYNVLIKLTLFCFVDFLQRWGNHHMLMILKSNHLNKGDLTLKRPGGHWWPLSPKFQFYFKKGSSKKFPMSVAPMSR